MEIVFTKGARTDAIAMTRADGTCADTTFPHKGPVPHDAVHLFVERELGLESGFWGLVAQGRHPDGLAAMARDGGHASAKRLCVPDAAIAQLIQAERVVECFEADMWSGQTGAATDLADLAATACAASAVAAPQLTEAAIARIRAELGAFAREWTAAPLGHVARVKWGP